MSHRRCRRFACTSTPRTSFLMSLAAVFLLAGCMSSGGGDARTPSASPTETSTVTAPSSPALPETPTTSATPTAEQATQTPTMLTILEAETPTPGPSMTPGTTPTAESTPPAVASDDPVVQALLDALPTASEFPTGWVESLEVNPDRGFTHVHCRAQPSMALDAYVLANGGVVDQDTLSDSTGPNVSGTYRSAAEDPVTDISVSLLDLSAVPIPDAGQVIVQHFLAEDTCSTWEREPGFVYEYGEVDPPLPPLGDGGMQWARTIHATTPRGEWNGLALVFAVGNRLVSISAWTTDLNSSPNLQVADVAASIVASLPATAFEPERRALLDTLPHIEIPEGWARQVSAYPDDALPHHCGQSLPLPEPQADTVTELRVAVEYTAVPGDRSTVIELTLMHLPTAADAQALVAFHQSDVTCERWTADAQQGIEVSVAPAEVVVPRLGDEPLWARALTVTSSAGERHGVAMVYAVENRVVFLTSLSPDPEGIPAYVLETLTWKLTEALRRFPARITFQP